MLLASKKNHRMLNRLAGLTLVAMFIVFNVCHAADNFPDRLELLIELQNRQYEQLEKRLHSYHSGSQDFKADEKLLAFTFETLANSNPEYASLFSDWIEAFPQSYFALVARAHYYYGVAWSWRGHRRIENTSTLRLQNMKEFLRLAALDLSRAIEIENELAIADALALKVLMLLDEKQYQQKALKEALQLYPQSYLVRSAYLWSLKPEWGGEAGELMKFIHATEELAGEAPVLSSLLGYADYIFAESLAERGQYQEAAVHFDFAVDKGADHHIYRERGINHYQLGNYAAARKDFDAALALWPQDPKTLRWRSHALRRLGENDAAYGDIDLAARLAPMDRHILMAYALLSRKLKRFEGVLASYDRALFYNQDDAAIWYERGMHFSHELVDFPAAGENFQRATELDPGVPAYWYEYAAVLHYQLDCGIVEPLDHYLELCDAGSSCKAGELEWARHAQDWLQETRRCSS